MKRTSISISLVFLGFCLNAQEQKRADSLYFYEQSRRQLEWAHSSTTQLLLQPFDDIAQSKLYAGIEQGSFRKAAEAYRQVNAGFHTNGLKKMGRFTLAGRFDVEKAWQDSAAWWNGGEYDQGQPYYFFAGKAGQYEKQLYRLSAVIAYRLWKDRLYIGTAGSYRYQWTTRSVDPRPEVKALAANFRPEISYRYKNHLVGLGIEWGRGSETNDISYKNRNYAGNQLYLDRNNFMSLGFGYIGKLGQSLRRYDETTSFFAQYAGQWKSWTVQAGGGYQLWQEDISIEEPSSRTYHDLYAFLQQDKGYGNLLVSLHRGRQRHQWEVSFVTQNLQNWASEFAATSYQYTLTGGEVVYRHLSGGKISSLELGGGLNWRNCIKQDAVAAHSYRLQYLRPHLSLSYYSRQPHGAWLAVGIKPGFRYVLTNEIVVPPTQENYFTRGVVYTDYLHGMRNSWGAEGRINWVFKNRQDLHRLGLTLTARWEQALAGEPAAVPALYIPRGSRWSGVLSMQFSL